MYQIVYFKYVCCNQTSVKLFDMKRRKQRKKKSKGRDREERAGSLYKGQGP